MINPFLKAVKGRIAFMMKNRTDFIGGTLADRLRQSARTYQYALKSLGMMLAGYIMANSYILDGISPFGIAMAAASYGSLWMPATFGVLMGYIFSLQTNFSMKYIAAVLLIACVKWVLDEHISPKQRIFAAPILACSTLTITALLVAYAYGFNGYNVVLSIAEGLLACGAAYFFSRSLQVLEMGQDFARLQRTESSCVIISCCILTAALTSLRIGDFSIGRMIAAGVIIVCAWLGHESLGTMAGVACGTAVTLASADSSFLLGSYALGGMFAGMFVPIGRLACCSAFLLTHIAICLALGQPEQLGVLVLEALLAAAVWMATPRSVLSSLRSQTVPATDNGAERGLKTFLISRLEDTSFALSDIAQTTQAVAQNLSKMQGGNLGEVYYQTADKICRKCGLKTKCWQEGYTDTMNCLNGLTFALKKTGGLQIQDFSEPLASCCPNKERLALQITDAYEDFVTKEKACRKLSQIRSVVTDQFDGMAELLDGITEQVSAVCAFDSEIEKKVSDYLQTLDMQPLDVVAYTNSDNRLYIRIKIYSSKLARMDKRQAAEGLSALLECDFAPPVIENRGTTATMLFGEKAALSVKVAYAQHRQGANKLCGDSYSIFHDKQGNAHMVLSDGMGSGSSAAVDSTMTVSLIRKLIYAGAGYDAALKLVNSALLVKSGEESLSTVDVTSLNLFTGKASFYKAGAAPTFVKKYRKTGYIESTSLPVGILTSAAFEKSDTTLKSGDIVLMVSDGATASGCEWIQNTLDNFIGEDLQALCDDIVKTARLKRADSHDDDITAMAAMIQRAS